MYSCVEKYHIVIWAFAAQFSGKCTRESGLSEKGLLQNMTEAQRVHTKNKWTAHKWRKVQEINRWSQPAFILYLWFSDKNKKNNEKEKTQYLYHGLRERA